MMRRTDSTNSGRLGFGAMDSRILWSIVLFSIAIRLAGAWFWQDQLQRDGQSFRFGDSHSYWTIASQIVRNQTYQYGSENSKIFRAPLYPLVLTPFTAIGQPNPNSTSVLLARVFGCVLGGLAVACILIATHKIAGSRAAVAAGLLASVYPGAVGMSIFILSEAVATPLFVASCALLLLACRARPTDANVSMPPTNSPQHARWFVLAAGMTLGLACLARPSWILWPIVAIPYLWIACKTSGSRLARHRLELASMLMVGVLLVMSPWWVRNFAVTGKFVPTTLQVGASLYDGWHPGASGSSDENMDFVIPFLAAQQAEDEMLAKLGIEPQSTFEWRVDQRLGRAALAWAWKNPSDVVRLSLLKLRKTWSPFPVAREVNVVVRWTEAIGYTFLLAAAWLGVWKLRDTRGAWLFVMPCVYLAILHMVFIGSVRYRQPGVLLLCPLAGAGCIAVLEWIRSRVQRSTPSRADKHR
jgi:4-amino-4-deoxy-L-arabinose transferase-like glycosyltransferase